MSETAPVEQVVAAAAATGTATTVTVTDDNKRKSDDAEPAEQGEVKRAKRTVDQLIKHFDADSIERLQDAQELLKVKWQEKRALDRSVITSMIDTLDQVTTALTTSSGFDNLFQLREQSRHYNIDGSSGDITKLVDDTLDAVAPGSAFSGEVAASRKRESVRKALDHCGVTTASATPYTGTAGFIVQTDVKGSFWFDDAAQLEAITTMKDADAALLTKTNQAQANRNAAFRYLLQAKQQSANTAEMNSLVAKAVDLKNVLKHMDSQIDSLISSVKS